MRFNMRLTEALNSELREAARILGKSVSSLVRDGIESIVRRALSDRKENEQVEQGPSETQGEI